MPGQGDVSVESEADIHEGGPAQTWDLLDTRPPCFNRRAVLLGPEVTTDDPNPVVHADVLKWFAGPALVRRDEAGVDTEEAVDDDVETGLLLHFSNHGINRVLAVLDAPSRQRPRTAAVPFDRQGEQDLRIPATDRVSGKSEAHERTIRSTAPTSRGRGPTIDGLAGSMPPDAG